MDGCTAPRAGHIDPFDPVVGRAADFDLAAVPAFDLHFTRQVEDLDLAPRIGRAALLDALACLHQ